MLNWSLEFCYNLVFLRHLCLIEKFVFIYLCFLLLTLLFDEFQLSGFRFPFTCYSRNFTLQLFYDIILVLFTFLFSLTLKPDEFSESRHSLFIVSNQLWKRGVFSFSLLFLLFSAKTHRAFPLFLFFKHGRQIKYIFFILKLWLCSFSDIIFLFNLLCLLQQFFLYSLLFCKLCLLLLIL